MPLAIVQVAGEGEWRLDDTIAEVVTVRHSPILQLRGHKAAALSLKVEQQSFGVPRPEEHAERYVLPRLKVDVPSWTDDDVDVFAAHSHRIHRSDWRWLDWNRWNSWFQARRLHDVDVFLFGIVEEVVGVPVEVGERADEGGAGVVEVAEVDVLDGQPVVVGFRGWKQF